MNHAGGAAEGEVSVRAVVPVGGRRLYYRAACMTYISLWLQIAVHAFACNGYILSLDNYLVLAHRSISFFPIRGK